MLLRTTTLALLGLALVVAGCGDQATRAVGPRDVMLNQTDDQHAYYVLWLHEFTEPGNVHGTAVSLFNAIKDAQDKEVALNALIQHLMANYSKLTAPTTSRGGDGTLDGELAYFLATIAAYYGIIDGGSLNVEHLITIVQENDIPVNGSRCFPTNLGNAATCLDRQSLTWPAFISITELETDNTLIYPPGFLPAGKVFEYNAYGSITGEVVVLLCTPKNHTAGTSYGILRAQHNSNTFDPKPHNTGDEFDGECEEFESPQASLFSGDNIVARGANAVGSFLISALTPKSLHATHSLAHRGTAYSHWTLGELTNVYTVKLVGVNSGTFSSANNHFTVARNSGNFTFYVEVFKDNVLQPCQANDVVKATPTFANVGQGAEVTASSCSFHGATNTQRHQITFTNLSQNISTTGSITFTVNNKPVANHVTFATQ